MRTWNNETSANLPSGPWTGEPDKAQWVDEATDLDCLIHRNRLGALCGYVGVPPEHPLHGKDYDELDVDVHGGLTYSDPCSEGDDPAFGICHIPEEGRPDDVWWFGFDCAHLGDLAPGMIQYRTEERAHGLNESYKPFAYVQSEVESLARQLVGLG